MQKLTNEIYCELILKTNHVKGDRKDPLFQKGDNHGIQLLQTKIRTQLPDGSPFQGQSGRRVQLLRAEGRWRALSFPSNSRHNPDRIPGLVQHCRRKRSQKRSCPEPEYERHQCVSGSNPPTEPGCTASAPAPAERAPD